MGCDEELVRRLRSMRQGECGAAILNHDPDDSDQPSLFIHVNDGIAYLHYFPDSRGLHPGFQARGMAPESGERDVHFLMIMGAEADSFAMCPEALVAVEIAYRAAEEFLREPAPPPSASWLEL